MSDTAEVSDASDQPSWPPLYAVCSLILPGQNVFCTRALQDKMLSKYKVFGVFNARTHLSLMLLVHFLAYMCLLTCLQILCAAGVFDHLCCWFIFFPTCVYLLSPNPLCSWCIRSMTTLRRSTFHSSFPTPIMPLGFCGLLVTSSAR